MSDGEMSELFIIGAGFSKAISGNMPIMKNLAKFVQEQIGQLPGSQEALRMYKKLASDPEYLLTYLFQELPSKASEDIHLDKSAFITLSRLIANYIAKREKEILALPLWARQFIEYIHEKEFIVATFNYDTVLERLSAKLKDKDKDNSLITNASIYRMPLIPLSTRMNAMEGTTYTFFHQRTYRLLKLHGSVNWFYAGDENIKGQQVYYTDVLPDAVGLEPSEQLMGISSMDLTPLIIPPVAEKSSFYSTQLVKVLWSEFRDGIRKARDIYCVGYSLPRTDLTTSLFLSSVVDDYKDKTIHIVNPATGTEKEKLIENYSFVFGKQPQELADKYLPSVEKMVDNLRKV